MKKFLVLSTLFSTVFSSCGKKVKVEYLDYEKPDTKDIKTNLDLKKIAGYKKIGFMAKSETENLKGKEIADFIRNWTYNHDDLSIGEKYSNVSGKVQMASSYMYNGTTRSLAKKSFEFKTAIAILKATLIAEVSKASGAKISLPSGYMPTDVFTDKFVSKIYITLNNKTRTTITWQNIKDAMIINARFQPIGGIKFATSLNSTIVPSSNQIVLAGYKPFTDLITNEKYKEFAKEAIKSKKLGLADKNLDALFISVEDGIHNTEDAYKSLVIENNFKDTEVIMFGEKAKNQAGSKEKLFAKDNITTGSFNKYASAYIAGYESAIMQLKWSKSEQKFENTDIAYLIASISDSDAKKKAIAFRAGVEAAIKNKEYGKYLKIKFVSKTQDSSKTSKKLYREISSWKEIKDSQTKLYEFSNSEDFSDATKRVIYIAGTTAKDWRGTSSDINANTWDKGDDTGLIGALFNFKPITVNNITSENLSSKTFSGDISIILDNKITTTNDKDDIAADNTSVEYKNVKVLGSMHDESIAIKLYAENILRGLFMEGDKTRLHKHSVFGSGIIFKDKIDWSDAKLRERNRKYIDILEAAFQSQPHNESDLIKESSWLK